MNRNRQRITNTLKEFNIGFFTERDAVIFVDNYSKVTYKSNINVATFLKMQKLELQNVANFVKGAFRQPKEVAKPTIEEKAEAYKQQLRVKEDVSKLVKSFN